MEKQPSPAICYDSRNESKISTKRSQITTLYLGRQKIIYEVPQTAMIDCQRSCCINWSSSEMYSIQHCFWFNEISLQHVAVVVASFVVSYVIFLKLNYCFMPINCWYDIIVSTCMQKKIVELYCAMHQNLLDSYCKTEFLPISFLMHQCHARVQAGTSTKARKLFVTQFSGI